MKTIQEVQGNSKKIWYSITREVFFYYMYKVSQYCSHILDAIPSLKSLIYILGINPILTMQRGLVVAINTAHQLYYLDVVNPTLKDLD
jgi:hypothetical protein